MALTKKQEKQLNYGWDEKLMNSILFGYDENLNKNKRDCTHHECPYTYCQHHKYWNGIEQEKLSFSQMNNISIKDDEVDMCMSHMDI